MDFNITSEDVLTEFFNHNIESFHNITRAMIQVKKSVRPNDYMFWACRCLRVPSIEPDVELEIALAEYAFDRYRDEMDFLERMGHGEAS